MASVEEPNTSFSVRWRDDAGRQRRTPMRCGVTMRSELPARPRCVRKRTRCCRVHEEWTPCITERWSASVKSTAVLAMSTTSPGHDEYVLVSLAASDHLDRPEPTGHRTRDVPAQRARPPRWHRAREHGHAGHRARARQRVVGRPEARERGAAEHPPAAEQDIQSRCARRHRVVADESLAARKATEQASAGRACAALRAAGRSAR